jgi:hypothetical protein
LPARGILPTYGGHGAKISRPRRRTAGGWRLAADLLAFKPAARIQRAREDTRGLNALTR